MKFAITAGILWLIEILFYRTQKNTPANERGVVIKTLKAPRVPNIFYSLGWMLILPFLIGFILVIPDHLHWFVAAWLIVIGIFIVAEQRYHGWYFFTNQYSGLLLLTGFACTLAAFTIIAIGEFTFMEPMVREHPTALAEMIAQNPTLEMVAMGIMLLLIVVMLANFFWLYIKVWPSVISRFVFAHTPETLKLFFRRTKKPIAQIDLQRPYEKEIGYLIYSETAGASNLRIRTRRYYEMFFQDGVLLCLALPAETTAPKGSKRITESALYEQAHHAYAADTLAGGKLRA